MTFQNVQRMNPDTGSRKRTHLYTVIEKLFYALGWVLVLLTFVAVGAIICGLGYFLVDALVLHGASFHNLG